jgi:PilZ domain
MVQRIHGEHDAGEVGPLRAFEVRQSCGRVEQAGFGFVWTGYRYSARAYQRMDSFMMAKQLTGSGHRWGQRIAVDIPVQVAAHSLPAIHGHLKNLSLSGALMETDHELPLQAHIAISVKLPGMGDKATTVMARVIRQLKDAVGVEWCEFAPTTVRDLLRSPSVRIPV